MLLYGKYNGITGRKPPPLASFQENCPTASTAKGK